MTKMKVWQTAEGTYSVSSETQDDRRYTIREYRKIVKGCPRSLSLWVCDCPHFEHRRVEECKHIERTKEALISGDYIARSELSELKQQLKRFAD